MFDSLSDGYCPQCLLEDKKIPLVVNQMDFWECPLCRLQCVSDGVSVLSIIRERGKGQLKDISATEWVKRFSLSRTDLEDITKSDGSRFSDERELRAFINEEL
jgi:hypothetical protein